MVNNAVGEVWWYFQQSLFRLKDTTLAQFAGCVRFVVQHPKELVQILKIVLVELLYSSIAMLSDLRPCHTPHQIVVVVQIVIDMAYPLRLFVEEATIFKIAVHIVWHTLVLCRI